MGVADELDMLARDTLLLLGENVLVTFLSGRTFTASPGETSAAATDLTVRSVRGPIRSVPNASLPGRANTMLETELVVLAADLGGNLPRVGDQVLVTRPGDTSKQTKPGTVSAVESEINGRHVRLRVTLAR